MLSIVALILATAFPSNSQTSWMRPEAFRLTIGMPRVEAVKTLESAGWNVKPADKPDFAYVDYSDDKAMTLEFDKERLRSIRFELYAVLSAVPKAFEEEKTYLRTAYGAPKRSRSKSVVLYESILPNIIVVMGNDPKGKFGKRGLGVLVVRYYDPTPRRKTPARPPAPH